MIRKVCFFGPKKMHFMQIESVLQNKNHSEPAKNWFSVALLQKTDGSTQSTHHLTLFVFIPHFDPVTFPLYHFGPQLF